MLTNFTKKIAFAIVLLSTLGLTSTAQLKPFTQVYSDNLKGGTVMFGNTMFNIVDSNNLNLIRVDKMNQTGNAANPFGLGGSEWGNDDDHMRFTDIDGTAGTTNSSSADLILPAGTNTIKFARLYWGGRYRRTDVTKGRDSLRKIFIRKGTSGAYTLATAPIANVDTLVINNTDRVYQSYVDVTQFVNTLGGGTYTIANLPASIGNTSGGGYYGGWAIVVAYENLSEPYNSIRIFNGFARVSSSGTVRDTLTGLNVPNNPLAADEAVLSTMAWEGDANLTGDYLRVNDVTVSNVMNPSTNFWNGSITKNGVNVTTKNPNYTNQMGIDIDEMNVGTGFGILPNATQVRVTFATEQDQYFPSLFAFKIRMKDPLVTLDKAVIDESGNGFVEGNEELTYVLSGTNTGTGVAYNATITDTLPSNVTYVANSLEIVNGGGAPLGPKTDAADGDQALKGTANGQTYVKFFVGTGATGTTGGQLSSTPLGDYSVRFKVRAGAIPGSISNTARITANSQAGDLFTDDGTAVIGDNGGPVPVKLVSFKATKVNDNGLVSWTTESELNNDYFIVQRSDDGIHFTDRGKVVGSGTTAFTHAYQLTDPLNTNSQVVYYRLKIVDRDAKYGFSKIIAIKLNGIAVNNFNVYPNPFISDIKVSVTSSDDEVASFRILSFDGKEMLTRKVSLQSGDNIVVLTNFGTLAKGNYILEVTTSTDKFIKKIVKN